MRLAPTLLRLLLIISLLVNGLGVAVAGVHGTALAGPASAVSSSTAPPCHSMDPSLHHSGAAASKAVPGADSTQERHCSGIDCLRACAQQPALAATVLHLPATAYSMAAPTAALDPGRPAPPLPAISRPPIG